MLTSGTPALGTSCPGSLAGGLLPPCLSPRTAPSTLGPAWPPTLPCFPVPPPWPAPHHAPHALPLVAWAFVGAAAVVWEAFPFSPHPPFLFVWLSSPCPSGFSIRTHRPAAGLTAVPRTGPHSPCVFPHRNTVLLPSPGFSPPPNRASSSLEVGPVDETFIHFFTRTWDSCGALPLSHRGAPLAESRPAFCAAGSDHL